MANKQFKDLPEVTSLNDNDVFPLDNNVNVSKKIRASNLRNYVNVTGSFLGLTDTPVDYSGDAGKAVFVNGGESALEFANVSGSHTIKNDSTPLTPREALNFSGAGVFVSDDAGNDETDIIISGSASKWGIRDEGVPETDQNWLNFVGNGVFVNQDAGNNEIEIIVSGSTIDTFIELTDTPLVYAGNSGTVPQVNSGENALIFSDPNNIVRRTLSVLVNGSSAITTGDGQAYFGRIPSYLNGWNIVEVAANRVVGTGLLTIMIHNLTQSADILSTALTVDANEKDSKDAAAPAVIDTSEDDVVTGDRFRVDIDGDVGTDSTWVEVQMTLEKP